MERQLAESAELQNESYVQILYKNEELDKKAKEVELTRQAMEDREKVHQKQLEDQKKKFMNHTKLLESQKNNENMISKMTKDIKPQIDEANEIAKSLA